MVQQSSGLPLGLKLIGVLVLAVVALIVIFSFIVIVPAGHRGVELEWSAVAGTFGEGLHIITPLRDSVVVMDVRTQKYQTDADSATDDLQSVFTTIAVNYHIDAGRVDVIYQQLGAEFQDRIISPAIEEAVKTVTARFTSEQMIKRREDVKNQINDELRDRLEKFDIIVDAVFIVNFDFSDQFNEAIEAKVTAEQNALTAQRKLEQIKFEADQKRAQAQGEADAKLAIAEAEAKSIQLQGDALRNNPEVTQLRWIEKWNGILPNYLLGQSALPILQIPTV